MAKRSASTTRFLLMLFLLPSLFVILLAANAQPARAEDVCARVKIEIPQELALERQAFEARMRITNGLSDIALENVGVSVRISDELGGTVQASYDPDNADALFFIRQPVLQGMDNVSGGGTVQGSSVAEITWLIIPARGAAKGSPTGTIYYIGATLSYKLRGEPYTMEVAPGHIFVKPMPEIALDYFIPAEVFGDDVFTPGIEPPVPFSLGARLTNNGLGTARGMKINSAQPKIVDNQQGLIIGFKIESAEVNGRPAQNTFELSLGDIGPGRSASARWTMTCSLSGRFAEFTADFSHSNELGGELTSLISSANTHFLIHDVLVDTPGKDPIRDFLATDGGPLRVFESEGFDTIVADQSVAATLNGSANDYTISLPATAGYVYARLADPAGGQKEIREVLRSDGKRIKPENAWLSKSRSNNHQWERHLNIFDANTTGIYSVSLRDAVPSPLPAIKFIPDMEIVEGNEVSFIVEATNPDGTFPSLSAAPLPARAAFSDRHDGRGFFNWATGIGQSGRYRLTFTAANGIYQTSRAMVITVRSLTDTDGDGLPDSWEMTHFGTLGRDGRGDFDRDGISDLDEFLLGADPAKKDPVPFNNGPSIPVIQLPVVNSEVSSLQPQLMIINSTDLENDSLQYTFEVYSDPEMTIPASGAQEIASGPSGTTSWTAAAPLNDNSKYYWRVKANDGVLFSQWAYGSFFVNTSNDAPSPFRLSSPRDNTSVDSRTPVLDVTNSTDPDGDALAYEFSVYSDPAMASLIASSPKVSQGADGITSWTVNVRLDNGGRYYWRSTVRDSHNAATQSPPGSFTVNTSQACPRIPEIISPQNGVETALQDLDLVIKNSPGAVSYIFEIDTKDSFTGGGLQTSGEIQGGSETTGWHVSGLRDGTKYFWRAKAKDGSAESRWVLGNFFVSSGNSAPAAPVVNNPDQLSWTNTRMPFLALNPVKNPGQSAISYEFEVYTDELMNSLTARNATGALSWKTPELGDNGWHYWRARAVDGRGMAGPWTDITPFFIRDNGANDPPQVSILEPSADTVTALDTFTIRWSGCDPDSSALISLYYSTEPADGGGDLIASDIDVERQSSHDWDISGVPRGAYYIYALISDGNKSITSHAPGRITIDRTALTVAPSVSPGTYSSAQTLTLSANRPAAIYYTFDGSDPGEGSILYSAPIAVTESATLRVLAIGAAGNRSEIYTLDYAIERDILVRVESDQRKLAGLNVYAFTLSGSYTGRSSKTDADGISRFNPADFKPGSYKFRADYLGYQFWTNPITVPGISDVLLIINESTAEIFAEAASGPAINAPVYLFSQSGAYLGISGKTDSSGKVSFPLPVNSNFKFRADILGSQYWSEIITIGSGANAVPVSAGGGILEAAITKDAGTSMPGVSSYLFNAGGAYLNMSQASDSSGMVRYSVPAGTYRIRADYLGYQFWSADCRVSENTSLQIAIPHKDVAVGVSGVFRGSSQPLSGVKVYLFTPAGSYMGKSAVSDASGITSFNLPEREYKCRADYRGSQFWSSAFKWQDTALNIPMADAVITVTGSGQPRPGIPVYVFTSSGSYLGLSGATNDSGNLTFRLPGGSYKFRADYQGGQFWSESMALAADQIKTVGISTGGASFTLSVVRGESDPAVNVPVHVFNETGGYLGISGTTGSSGLAEFALSSGAYKFRVTYRGLYFWSGTVSVPGQSVLSMLIEEIGIKIKIQTSAGPAAGVTVYAFSENGSYLGLSTETDGSGYALFRLPAGGKFKFRADLLGNQYWSDIVNAAGDTPVATVPAGGGTITARVANGSLPLAGINTYLFNSSGSYLGMNKKTDSAGTARFDVPSGLYKIRADHLGNQFWSAQIQIDADTELPILIPHQDVYISVNAAFQGALEPLAGIPVYLFSGTDGYLGQSIYTDANGTVAFNLPEREYRARADCLGMNFWSSIFVWQNATINIPMAEAAVSVTGSGQPHAGIPVYAFGTNGNYLGRSGQTDSSGRIALRLPAGAYKFRADYQGHQYWSMDTALTAGQTAPAGISTGGGTFSLRLQRTEADPLIGVRCYAFNDNGSYPGISGISSSDGEISFDLSTGSYKFRADYLGYQFWSGASNVPDNLSTTFTIPHQDMTVSVSSIYKNSTEPLAGLNVYLYTAPGAYVNRQKTTGSGGQVTFSLPDCEYKARVDYLGRQFWTGPFRWRNSSLLIKHGAASVNVHNSVDAIQGASVYAFSEGGSYIGSSAVTDASGRALLSLPAQRCKFRVDANGNQYWSEVVEIVPDMEISVEVVVN